MIILLVGLLSIVWFGLLVDSGWKQGEFRFLIFKFSIQSLTQCCSTAAKKAFYNNFAVEERKRQTRAKEGEERNRKNETKKKLRKDRGRESNATNNNEINECFDKKQLLYFLLTKSTLDEPRINGLLIIIDFWDLLYFVLIVQISQLYTADLYILY